MNENSNRMPNISRIIEATLADAPRWLLNGQVLLLPTACVDEYNAYMTEEIPQLRGVMTMIGYDWIGRPIGVLNQKVLTLGLYDAMFDELMEFEYSKDELSESRLFDPSEDNFGRDEYFSFLQHTGIQSIELGSCAGFTIPPQLGGQVSYLNMEIYDLRTYWSFISLLDEAIGTVPVGTMLKRIVVQ